jgi:hypothetical protein
MHMTVNFTGIWNANLSKSRFLGPLPTAITVRIEHSDPELREEILVRKVDGSEERVVFECWTNGEQGKSLIWSLSPDGQTLSMEHRRDDLAGQRTVLDRAG